MTPSRRLVLIAALGFAVGTGVAGAQTKPVLQNVQLTVTKNVSLSATGYSATTGAQLSATGYSATTGVQLSATGYSSIVNVNLSATGPVFAR
jgi:hypothetical protein